MKYLLYTDTTEIYKFHKIFHKQNSILTVLVTQYIDILPDSNESAKTLEHRNSKFLASDFLKCILHSPVQKSGKKPENLLRKEFLPPSLFLA